jgi:tRNA (guanine-N1)-methyltransferase
VIFDVLTLFPEMFSALLGNSIIKRAQDNGILTIRLTQIRDFANNKHNRVDDYPFGGGPGMLMQAEPIYLAYQHITKGLDYRPHVIYMSPQGQVFKQSMAQKLSVSYDHIVILCGHYEGVDQRILDEIVDEEISIGDFVLTGGEIGAVAVIDATARLIKGVLSDEENYDDESFTDGLLEYPQYTRPREFLGKSVPDELLSGNHALIAKWKRKHSILNTYKKRPELLEGFVPQNKDEKALMRQIRSFDIE